ncbi:MAG: LON peptidase substrate-binding domain-containing protein [Alphaproteobacteria bacterium]
MSVFDARFEELPESLPVFPLAEVLLLPRGNLPLNIFEPRYLAMVEDALAAERMIGMIQPRGACGAQSVPELFHTGCAGRICRFEETGDGRYLIALRGVCRFDIAEEQPAERGYRRVHADWSPYEADLTPGGGNRLDRDRLLAVLERYFAAREIDADWEAVREAPEERLVNCLSMICPFDAPEKQALLEAPDLEARAEMLTALMEMAALGEDAAPGCRTRQ